MLDYSKLQSIRTSLRKNSKAIINTIIQNHIQLYSTKYLTTPICMFCGSNSNITKEHVLPRWVFDKSTEGFFTTNVNGLNQTYNKTTIPACLRCNSDLLNELEKIIQKVFDNRDIKKTPFLREEIENIIRWLEIIDYKFQILNAIRKFKVSKQGDYIPYLANFPISVLRESVNYSPEKAITEIRRSQKRITLKNKSKRINSLVSFKTTNKSFHFFHHMDDFIFLEFPKQQVALFYFYKSDFNNEILAHEAAMEVIKTFY